MNNQIGSQIERGEAIKVSGLAKYSKGCIVSRTIYEKDAGSMTVFAFDKGQIIKAHSSPYDATVCLIEGQGKFIVGGKSKILRKGEMMIMPANVPHAVEAPGRFKMLLVMIKGSKTIK